MSSTKTILSSKDGRFLVPQPVMLEITETYMDYILDYYFAKPQLVKQWLIARYSELHRHYHDLSHLNYGLQRLAQLDGSTSNALALAWMFHDSIYDPGAKDNEDQSAGMLMEWHSFWGKLELATDMGKIIQLILLTKHHKPETPWDIYNEEYMMVELDFGTFHAPETSDLLQWRALRWKTEQQIWREYQRFGWYDYRHGRIEFLQEHDRTPEFVNMLWVWEPRIALYPGVFNPLHIGHLNVIRKAEQVFDQVIPVVCGSAEKPDALQNLEQRFAAVQAQLPYHEVRKCGVLLADYANEYPDVTIIRGVRNAEDLEDQFVQHDYNAVLRSYYTKVKTVMIACDPKYRNISSTGVRSLQAAGFGVTGDLVPDEFSAYGTRKKGSI